MALSTSWTAYVKDADRKDEIRKSVLAATVMRRRMKEILLRKMESSWTKSLLEESYDTPNWALKQADARGYERAMREIVKLIDD